MVRIGVNPARDQKSEYRPAPVTVGPSKSVHGERYAQPSCTTLPLGQRSSAKENLPMLPLVTASPRVSIPADPA